MIHQDRNRPGKTKFRSFRKSPQGEGEGFLLRGKENRRKGGYPQQQS
jgi:hypothetical protein